MKIEKNKFDKNALEALKRAAENSAKALLNFSKAMKQLNNLNLRGKNGTKI